MPWAVAQRSNTKQSLSLGPTPRTPVRPSLSLAGSPAVAQTRSGTSGESPPPPPPPPHDYAANARADGSLRRPLDATISAHCSGFISGALFCINYAVLPCESADLLQTLAMDGFGDGGDLRLESGGSRVAVWIPAVLA